MLSILWLSSLSINKSQFLSLLNQPDSGRSKRPIHMLWHPRKWFGWLGTISMDVNRLIFDESKIWEMEKRVEITGNSLLMMVYHSVDIRTVTNWPGSTEDWPEADRWDDSPCPMSFNESGVDIRSVEIISGLWPFGFWLWPEAGGLWSPIELFFSSSWIPVLWCVSFGSSSSSVSLDLLCFYKREKIKQISIK